MQNPKSIGPTVAESLGFFPIFMIQLTDLATAPLCLRGTQHKCQVFFTMPARQPPKFLRKKLYAITIFF